MCLLGCCFMVATKIQDGEEQATPPLRGGSPRLRSFFPDHRCDRARQRSRRRDAQREGILQGEWTRGRGLDEGDMSGEVED